MKSIITAALVLAITLTLAACEEKKKQDGADTKPPETATAPATATACGNGGSSVKLPCIADENGNVQRFEYDEQNRIIKIGNETITYADNLITVGTKKFAIKGNTVTYDGGTYTIDKDGYIVNDGKTKYEYKDGNLIKGSWEYGDVDSYSYDDKKFPFSNCKSPKWLLGHIFRIPVSKNNIIKRNTDGGEVSSIANYKYQYDSEGFPTKKTEETSVEGNDETSITNYTYYGSK